MFLLAAAVFAFLFAVGFWSETNMAANGPQSSISVHERVLLQLQTRAVYSTPACCQGGEALLSEIQISVAA